MDNADNEVIVKLFKDLVQSQDMAVPVAAMNSLVLKLKESKANTWMQLEKELRAAIARLKDCDQDDLGGRSQISVGSGCDLFMKYVTRAFNLEFMDFASCKEELLRRGEQFAGMSLSSRAMIAELGHSFIQDNCTVLIHGASRVVNALVMKAAESKHFNIIVTESRPDGSGFETARLFADRGIPTKVILDSAVGAIMEEVDLCLVGAEGVMENGGIVNRVGTYQIALVAKALQRPFYVAVESYKFARMYPLAQRDVLNMAKPSEDTLNLKVQRNFADMPNPLPKHISIELPTIDFTPAKLITLLFTDLGVLTPAAVSDELIRLYQ